MNALTLQYYGQFVLVPGISDNRAIFSMNVGITGSKLKIQPEYSPGCQNKLIITFDHHNFAANPFYAESAF